MFYLYTMDTVPDDLLWFPEMVTRLTHKKVSFGQINNVFTQMCGNDWNRRVEKLMNDTVEQMTPKDVSDLKTKLEALSPKPMISITSVFNNYSEHIIKTFWNQTHAAQYLYLMVTTYKHDYPDSPKTIQECLGALQGDNRKYTCDKNCCCVYVDVIPCE